MGSEVIVVVLFWAVLFGIAYLYFSTRHKERLALIEKGVDASVFVKGRQLAGCLLCSPRVALPTPI
ncbi:MAG: hypothetical protein P8X60_01910 [Robiginitalea sp.]